MVKTDTECKSDDERLYNENDERYFNNVWECADACQEIRDCKYFIYGKREKDGECYWEQTESADCPEGWYEDDKYDFYEIISKLTSDKLIEFLGYN